MPTQCWATVCDAAQHWAGIGSATGECKMNTLLWDEQTDNIHSKMARNSTIYVCHNYTIFKIFIKVIYLLFHRNIVHLEMIWIELCSSAYSYLTVFNIRELIFLYYTTIFIYVFDHVLLASTKRDWLASQFSCKWCARPSRTGWSWIGLWCQNVGMGKVISAVHLQSPIHRVFLVLKFIVMIYLFRVTFHTITWSHGGLTWSTLLVYYWERYHGLDQVKHKTYDQV